MTAKELREQALALTRAQTTDDLVASFQMTEPLLDSGLAEADWATVTTARGFIIDVLEERGELALIFPEHEAEVAE